MATPPSSDTVYNTANGYGQDSRTPGVNSVVVAWKQLEAFATTWGPGVYNGLQNMATLLGDFVG